MDTNFTPIQLTDEYRIGVDSIDQEHGHLINIYNELVKAAGSAGEAEIAAATLKKLFEYADYHFASEERVMASVSYPEMEGHHRQHESFIRALDDLAHAQTGSESEILGKLLTFVKNWIRGHILLTDKRLGEFVHSQYQGPRPSAG